MSDIHQSPLLYYPHRRHTGNFSRYYANTRMLPGKSLLLNRLKGEGIEVTETSPFIGRHEELTYNDDFEFRTWRFGGAQVIKPAKRSVFAGSEAIIFIIDSTDRGPFEDRYYVNAVEELAHVLGELPRLPLLVLANKQDAPDAMPVTDIAEKLALKNITHRQWFIQGCSAMTSEGVREGLQWLKDQWTSQLRQ